MYRHLSFFTQKKFFRHYYIKNNLTMKTLTKENLNRLIASRIEDFKKAHNAISSYNSEQQTMGDYNGRQILELIQNADDAGAKNIFIQLNPEKSLLEEMLR